MPKGDSEHMKLIVIFRHYTSLAGERLGSMGGKYPVAEPAIMTLVEGFRGRP